MGTLGDEIRKLRQRKGLMLTDLGKKLDTTAGYLSRIEARDEMPSAEMICRIAGALNADAEELLDLAKSDALKRTEQDLQTKHQQALSLYRRKK